MSTAQQIGTVASSTDKLLVQRLGEQLTLRQGDAILAGDVMQNTDSVAVDVELKALAAGQADSLVTLAPNSAAQVNTVAGADGAAASLVEVTSLTEGVELYAVGDGANGAVLADNSAAGFSGLVGAGLLAGGGGLASAGTVAAVVGGGAGIAAIASSNNDDTAITATTDTRVENGDGTEAPGNETPVEEEEVVVEEPGAETPAPEPVAESPLSPLIDALANTPLAPLGDVLTMVTSALPLSSIPTSPDALPIPIPLP